MMLRQAHMSNLVMRCSMEIDTASFVRPLQTASPCTYRWCRYNRRTMSNDEHRMLKDLLPLCPLPGHLLPSHLLQPSAPPTLRSLCNLSSPCRKDLQNLSSPPILVTACSRKKCSRRYLPTAVKMSALQTLR